MAAEMIELPPYEPVDALAVSKKGAGTLAMFFGSELMSKCHTTEPPPRRPRSNTTTGPPLSFSSAAVPHKPGDDSILSEDDAKFDRHLFSEVFGANDEDPATPDGVVKGAEQAGGERPSQGRGQPKRQRASKGSGAEPIKKKRKGAQVEQEVPAEKKAPADKEEPPAEVEQAPAEQKEPPEELLADEVEGEPEEPPAELGEKTKGEKQKGKKAKGEKQKGNKKKSRSGKDKQKKSKKAAADEAAKALEASCLEVFPEIKLTPVCNKCKRRVDPLNARLVGKAQGVWQCRPCGVRYTQLHRQWGGWPPREFDQLSPDEKSDFWTKMEATSTEAAREELVLNTLTTRVTESRSAGAKGKYLPLGVYINMGYDGALIEKNCKDFFDDPIAGKVYRVDVEFQDKRKTTEKIKEHLLKSIQDRKCGDNANSSGQRGRQQTGSKGSGKGGKGGKGNGTKPGRIAPDPPTTATKKTQSDAIKIMAKVSPLLFSLSTTLKHKKLSLLPKPLIDKQKTLQSELSVMEKAAQKTMSHQDILSVELTEVAEKCLSATNHNALISGMLNNL